MRGKRLYAGVIAALVVLQPVVGRASDAGAVIEALRQQMKSVHTIRAGYKVSGQYGPGKKRGEFAVKYLLSGRRYDISETAIVGGDGVRQVRTVSDGFEVKMYRLDESSPTKSQGMLFKAEETKTFANGNDILLFAGFAMSHDKVDEVYRSLDYQDEGSEQIDGHECRKLSYTMPYPGGSVAHHYLWIESAGSQYVLRKNRCVLDDDIEKVLYERRYEYDLSSGGYPFPDRIEYDRWAMKPDGGRVAMYSVTAEIDMVEINGPVDQDEFIYEFPEGTVVSITPLSTLVGGDPNSAATGGDPNLSEPDERREFSIIGGEEAILLPLRIGGREYMFVVDTGASHTVFDAALREYLGKPIRVVRGHSAANPVAAWVFNAPKAYVGPFGLEDCGSVFCTDLRMAKYVFGKDLGGILGMNFLKQHVSELDSDKRVLRFLDGAEIGADWGEPVKLRYNQVGIPMLEVKGPDGVKGDYIMDTAATASGFLEKGTFDSLVKGGDTPVMEGLVSTASGTVVSREARVGSMSVGPFEYRGLIMGEGERNAIGVGLLLRHRVILDFPSDKVYLKKAAGFDRVDESDMTGLHLLRVDGRTVVHSVDKGSVAEQGGVRSGDVVEKVNGVDAGEYEMWQIRGMNRGGDGREMELSIRRGDESLKVVFRLKKRI